MGRVETSDAACWAVADASGDIGRSNRALDGVSCQRTEQALREAAHALSRIVGVAAEFGLGQPRGAVIAAAGMR